MVFVVVGPLTGPKVLDGARAGPCPRGRRATLAFVLF
jgi:hypothetical protein